MKTLTQYNEEKMARFHELQELERRTKFLGIACPECGLEMFNPNPHIVLTSNPPQHQVACTCGYFGSAII